MEFQSGQNCVTEIKDMLYAKYIKTLCYIENIETCAKYTNVVLKMQKHYAQNVETLLLKMQKSYTQNAEILCSKFRNVMFKMWKCAQNVETLCSKCRNVMLKNRSL